MDKEQAKKLVVGVIRAEGMLKAAILGMKSGQSMASAISELDIEDKQYVINVTENAENSLLNIYTEVLFKLQEIVANDAYKEALELVKDEPEVCGFGRGGIVHAN